MKVLKFGGTSLGSPERMKEVARLIQNSPGCIVVLSAISGTTNALVALSKLLFNQDLGQFNKQLSQLEEHYIAFIQELLDSDELREEAYAILTEHLNQIDAFSRDMFTVHEERAILAQGELLSTALFVLHCKEIGVKAELLPALEFMRINSDLEPDSYYIWVNLDRMLKERSSADFFVTQGYICRNAYGELDNLKRGGSDYSASLIGAAVDAEEIQVWTDIDGMHNNDPRFVTPTKPIRHLSFAEAAELAYFGAKILHPSSVRPAQEKGIPVRLKNTLDPEAEGTLISEVSEATSIKAVAAKDGITAIKIKSGRMLLAYGFLKAVFEVFELYKTPIDMVTTSEVAVSVTIDNAAKLNEVVADLEKFGQVEVDEDLTIVCVVGDFLAEHAGFAARIMSAVKEIPLRMVSYGGSRNNVSFLVATKDKANALQALNDNLF